MINVLYQCDTLFLPNLDFPPTSYVLTNSNPQQKKSQISLSDTIFYISKMQCWIIKLFNELVATLSETYAVSKKIDNFHTFKDGMILLHI